MGRLTAAWLVVLAIVGVFAFGGVHTPVRALLHLLLAGALGTAAFLPDSSLTRLGALRGWLIAGAAVTCAVCAGLVPVPEGLRAFVAQDARTGWSFASVDAERTVSVLMYAWWLTGLGIAVTTVSVVLGRRRPFEWALVVAVAAVLVVAGVHWFGKFDKLFGRFPLPYGDNYSFAAPFIDRSHFGSFVLLGFPLLVGWGLDSQRGLPERLLGGGLALLSGSMLVVVGSVAPIAIAFTQLVAVGWLRGRFLPLLAAAGPVGALAIVGSDLWFSRGATLSLHGRLDMWSASLNLLRTHWLFGAGAGTFVEAVQPYRTDFEFSRWDHAHNDWLEAVVETGLVGLPFWLLAAFALRPRTSRDASRSALLELGVAGILLHATIEFPLVLPALAGGVVATWAVRRAMYEPQSGTSRRLARSALIGAAALQLVGLSWTWRTDRVENARQALTGERWVAGSVQTLRWLAPWSAELALAEAWRAAEADPRRAGELAISLASDHPADPETQRRAATLLGQVGRYDEAAAIARTAVALAPSDWRNRVVLATVLSAAPDQLEAVTAWQDALRAGAPPAFYPAAWKVVPVGLVWMDAIEDLPSSYHAALGQFLVRAGDLETASLVFEEALLDGDAESRYPAYVDALLAQGRLAEADRYVRSVLADEPRNREFRRRLGRVLEAREEWLEAARVWEKLATEERGVREAPVRAVVCTERGAGTEEALVLVRRFRLSRLGGAALTLEESAIHERAGNRTGCVDAVLRSGDLDDPKYGRRLQRQLERCRLVSGLAPPGDE